MKKDLPKLIVIFLIVVGVVIWTLNYLFLSGKTAPRSRASGETVELSFDPSSSTAVANQDFLTTIKIKPLVDISLRGYLINLVFDKTKISLKKIEYKIGVASVDLGDSDSTLTTVNQNGRAKLQGEVQTATGQVIPSTAAVELVKLTFTAISTSGTTIQIGSNDVKFYIINSDMSLSEVSSSAVVSYTVNGGGPIITGTPTPTVTPGGPTLTPTPTGGATVKLNLRLRFQGIIKAPVKEQSRTMAVKVTTINTSTNIRKLAIGTCVFDTATVGEDIGSWNCQVGLDVPLSPPETRNYYLLIKGENHIQKKICDQHPEEKSSGTYGCSTSSTGIALNSTNIGYDFSKIILLAGDLDQNGIVDSVDIALVRNNLGKTDAATLAKADLNRDGIVDTQDFSLILAALAVRTDEQ